MLLKRSSLDLTGIISALCALSINVEHQSIAKAALQTIDIDMVMSMPYPLVVWLGSSYQELGSTL